jgi:hypothetical protein
MLESGSEVDSSIAAPQNAILPMTTSRNSQTTEPDFDVSILVTNRCPARGMPCLLASLRANDC